MPRESKQDRRQRALDTLDVLERAYPDATTALHFTTPFACLVATILSAQCTDERVNKTTPALFAAYPTVADYAAADRAKLEEHIRATGFYQKKAQAIMAAAQAVAADHGGQLPDSMDALTALPGVARKTANVVLQAVWGRAAGIVVDTHVARLSHRLGWVARQQAKTVNTDRIERELMDLLPPERWRFCGFGLILHGRAVCTARAPHCDTCVVAATCPRRDVTSG